MWYILEIDDNLKTYKEYKSGIYNLTGYESYLEGCFFIIKLLKNGSFKIKADQDHKDFFKSEKISYKGWKKEIYNEIILNNGGNLLVGNIKISLMDDINKYTFNGLLTNDINQYINNGYTKII